MELLFLLILILTMAIALGSGFPVAFALPGSAILSISLAAICGFIFENNIDAYFHSGSASQWISAGVTNLRGIYWEVERDTLIAIPLFIFMGIMLQRSKIAEDLLVTMAQLFGRIPGGLGISVVFVGALLAATTGIVGATVVAMGLISLPAMLRNKYSPSLATGTIAASGTLGQIIPPSIVLIILADQLASATDQASTLRKNLFKENTGELMMPSVFDVTSTSAGEMFLGAFLPGLVLVGLYMLFILVLALLFPKTAPAVPYDGKVDKSFWLKVFLTLVPPLTLIIIVLGSIITGIATVNQAGAIGAAGAIVMAGYRLQSSSKTAFYPAFVLIISLILIGYSLINYEMNVKAVDTEEDRIGIMIGAIGTLLLISSLIWSGIRLFDAENTMKGVMLETAKTTSLVFIILLGAAMLTAAFRAFGGEDLVRDYLNSLAGGFWTKFIVVMAVIFILGFFLDFIEIAVVVVPIVAPILLADPSANITAVWLGVMIGLNIQTSFLTPPFGFALFYLRGVAPAIVKTVQMYKGVIPFITLQLLALGVVGFYPSLVNYLPNRVSFLSETSPPPKNPKLQYCIEKYVGENVLTDENNVKKAVFRVREVDLTTLPKSYQSLVIKSIDDVNKGLVHLNQAFKIEEEINKKAVDYEPQLLFVRNIEKDIRILEKESKEIKTLISRLEKNQEDEKKLLQNDLIAKKTIIDNYKSQIPSDWPNKYKDFQSLIKKEKIERSKYRRLMDGSYNEIFKIYTIINLKDTFSMFESRFKNISAKLEVNDPKQLIDEIKLFTQELNKIPDNRNIISSL
ncbi:MAG: C4-dicarboxylate ABC transporter permease, partial [Gammaproteobacteria bacterium]|nr:C4-dicarboxylate ABC transporter permease [Gammaproteobacteria bacterium]